MKEIQSLLIVKTSAIGDVIQTFPAVEYLRKRFPHARIDWVVEKEIAPLLSAHPDLSHVIPIDSRIWRKSVFSTQTWDDFSAFKEKLRATYYDVVFDFQANIKSAVVTGCARAHEKVGFGWSSAKERANLLVTTKRISIPEGLNIQEKYFKLAQLYFGDTQEHHFSGVRLKITPEEESRLQSLTLDSRPFMVCFGSKWVNKQLSVESWIDLLKKIDEAYQPFFFLVYGDSKEKQMAEEIHSHFPRSQCIGEMSLPFWQALMWKMQVVISVDSAALHLCATTTTPSFSIFGPSLAKVYKPLGVQHGAFQGACPYSKSFKMRCPALRTCKTGACLRSLEMSQVFDQFQIWTENLTTERRNHRGKIQLFDKS